MSYLFQRPSSFLQDNSSWGRVTSLSRCILCIYAPSHRTLRDHQDRLTPVPGKAPPQPSAFIWLNQMNWWPVFTLSLTLLSLESKYSLSIPHCLPSFWSHHSPAYNAVFDRDWKFLWWQSSSKRLRCVGHLKGPVSLAERGTKTSWKPELAYSIKIHTGWEHLTKTQDASLDSGLVLCSPGRGTKSELSPRMVQSVPREQGGWTGSHAPHPGPISKLISCRGTEVGNASLIFWLTLW